MPSSFISSPLPASKRTALANAIATRPAAPDDARALCMKIVQVCAAACVCVCVCVWL